MNAKSKKLAGHTSPIYERFEKVKSKRQSTQLQLQL